MESIIFLGMNPDMWIVLLTILVVFGLMLFTKLPGDYVFMGSMVVFVTTGVLPVDEALSSFSSESVIMTGALFVIIAGLVYSGVLQWIVKYCLGMPKTYGKALLRLMFPVAMLSTVLSNTTVVALFLRAVKMWARRLGIAPSKLLIPLSYASCMGGTITLIGSPTNLVIAGFYADDMGEAMGLFTPTVVGMFCLVVGILSTLALSRLLPVRKSQEDALENVSDYTVELLVPTECPHVGETVEEAGLYKVPGGHIIEIIRFDHEIISPVSKDEFIFGGDRLVFSGDVERILELRKSHQLVNATHHVFTLDEVDRNRRLQMANVRFTSPLLTLTCVCLCAIILSELVSNTAAAAILYPVAYQAALTMNVNPMTFCIGLLIAVSCCFASPVGSPTHMLVYGPGGYRFSDFMRLGLIMNVIILAATLFITPIVFPF